MCTRPEEVSAAAMVTGTLSRMTAQTSTADGPADWVAQLRERKRRLSPAEGKVAALVLDRPETAMRLSITQLAEAAGVGEATVSRLARRLGFTGFHAFKIAIAQTLAPGTATRSPLARTGGDYPQWAESSVAEIKASLDETLDIFDAATFQRAVDLLGAARRIEWFGSGASGAVAIMAQQRFVALGRPCAVHVDPHLQLVSAATVSRDDVVVGISKSGSTKDLHDSMAVARESGAHTISVTAVPRSPLASLSDVVLLAGGAGDTLVSNLFHEVATLVVLEMLAQACARELGEEAAALEQRVAAAIAPRIY
jgi:DNA-binding MurR/RpiR family transcriptional regulator